MQTQRRTTADRPEAAVDAEEAATGVHRPAAANATSDIQRNETTFERNANNDIAAAWARSVDGGQLFHERSTSQSRQMAGRHLGCRWTLESKQCHDERRELRSARIAHLICCQYSEHFVSHFVLFCIAYTNDATRSQPGMR